MDDEVLVHVTGTHQPRKVASSKDIKRFLYVNNITSLFSFVSFYASFWLLVLLTNVIAIKDTICDARTTREPSDLLDLNHSILQDACRSC